MKKTFLFFTAFAIALAGSAAAQPAPGKVKGGEVYAIPAWFKQSFLDLRTDVEEAQKRGRHVLLFLHLDECPYCARMLKESFTSGDNKDYIERHFDVIAINLQGSLELTWTDGATFTEKAFARHVGAFATPTIVFLGPDGGKVLQLTGYRDPRALRYALEYVQGRRYASQTFPAYLAARERPAVYAFRDHPNFSNATYFKGYAKPLAVLFEDRYCADCARFHEKTLSHPDVVREMANFLFVRLDAESTRPIVDLEGRTTTPAQWVQALGLSYRPALVLFDGGREIFRADGQLYHQHLHEALRYVGRAYYRQYDSISQYRGAYRAERLKQGLDIDYSE